MMNEETESLDWQAMRYMLGELSPEDTAEFEDQLAVDQSAREAVAAAVELAGAVAAAQDSRPLAKPRRRPALSRMIGYSCLAAAACLFVILVAQSVWRNRSGGMVQPDGAIVAAQSNNAAVALAWRELRTELADELDSEPALASNDVEAAEQRADIASDDADDEADVPWWMIVGTGSAARP